MCPLIDSLIIQMRQLSSCERHHTMSQSVSAESFSHTVVDSGPFSEAEEENATSSRRNLWDAGSQTRFWHVLRAIASSDVRSNKSDQLAEPFS